MKTFKHFSGREMSVIEITNLVPTKYHDINSYRVGDKVDICYHGDSQIGTVSFIGTVPTNHHKFTHDTLEVYHQLCLKVTFEDKSEFGIYTAYPYPMKKIA